MRIADDPGLGILMIMISPGKYKSGKDGKDVQGQGCILYPLLFSS